MKIADFENIKQRFQNASIEDKIQMYIGTKGLSEDQYMELLHLFPISEIHKLEEAMG